MRITTISSREFNQNTSLAKRAASNGPVFITDRGDEAFVLLTAQEYRKLTAEKGQSVVDLVSMPEVADIDFTPPKLLSSTLRPADFS